MPFTMKLSNDTLEGKDVVPAGLYKVRLDSFKPKLSAIKPGGSAGMINFGGTQSYNLNAKMEITDNPDHAGRFVYEGLNELAGWVLVDFSHAFGFSLETDGKTSWLQGMWDGDEKDPSTWIYKGPMLGAIAEVEVAVDSYNNKPNNKISRYICRVPDCARKFPKLTHSMNLLKK